MIGLRTLGRTTTEFAVPFTQRAPFFKESIMKKKNTPQPRNYLVKLAMFRKAGSHRKSNKAIRRNDKVKIVDKMYPIIDITVNSVYNRIYSVHS